MMTLIERIAQVCEGRNSPAGTDSPGIVRSHRLPEEYFTVVGAANGFYLQQGVFRFFGLSPFGLLPSIAQWNANAWVSEYKHALDDIVVFAEDIFGDQYAFQYDRAGRPPQLVKFWCEGAEIESVQAASLDQWLLQHVLVPKPSMLDIDLVEVGARRGLRPRLDEHLAFSLPLILGGEYAPDNLEISQSTFHLSLLGQITVKNRPLQDGARVRRFGES